VQLEDRSGVYQAPIIQKVINSMWFANKRNEGVVFDEYFRPFPKVGLALVLTAVAISR